MSDGNGKKDDKGENEDTPSAPHKLLNPALAKHVSLIHDLIAQDNAINLRLSQVVNAWIQRGDEVTTQDYEHIAEQLLRRGVINTAAAVGLNDKLDRRREKRE